MAEILPWATALGDTARYVLYTVIAAMAASAALHILQPRLKKDVSKLARTLFYTGSSGFFFSFAVLIVLFLNHQFQFQYVAKHSKLDHELEYLVAGVWSGQEGSFLLWAVASAIFGVLAIRKTAQYERWFTAVYALFLGALAAILSYESPFLKFPPGPEVADGAGMPPTLMNYWVVIHPPVIFLGFGSLTVLFAFAIAAMLHKDLNEWVKIARSWAIVGLSLLGVGLCMGGFWAYETLGWGGFWMWDPVENTSFVPWVLLAAFIHGIFVQLSRQKWHVLNAVLAGLPFVLFCYGTFLTRSGFLGDTSVHSFAQMDRSALWLLTGIGSAALLGLVGVSIWSARQQPKPEAPLATPEYKLNRESMYGTGVWLMSIFAIFIAIGMSVPFLTGTILNRQQAVVEEKLYHQVLSWPFPFICLLVALTPFVTWRGISARELFGKVINTLAVSVGLVGFALLWLKWAGSEAQVGPFVIAFPGVPIDPEKTLNLFGNVNVNQAFWVLFLSWLCLFAVLANLNRGWFQMKKSKTSFGGHLTHVGLMLTLLGLVFSRGFEQSEDLFIHPTVPAERRTAFGYQVDLVGRTTDYTDRNNKIEFTVSNGQDTFTATPGLYFMMGQDGPVPNKIPYILSRPLYDLYIICHEFTFAGSEPTPLQKGETARFNNILVTYNGYRTEGPGGGMAGTKFIADLTVQTVDGTKSVSPYFGITDVPGQPDQPKAVVNDDIALRLAGIDAATGGANIIADYRTEMFPVQVFYKPLTILVWWGVGIMTLGGFLAAYSRRYRPQKPEGPAGQTQSTPDRVEETDDAPQHLAQV